MDPNKFHVIWFDPGAAATGWAHVSVDRKAFSRPEHKVLANLHGWQSGEFTGPEKGHMKRASDLIRYVVERSSYLSVYVGTEDFDLVQTVGSKENLLSPVRINAVLDWECSRVGVQLHYQNRSERSNQTKERLKLFGFNKNFKKDEFAAMQHLVYRLRKMKEAANARPWKLASADVINDRWDCACVQRRPCDLVHQK